mmetsp:Transcript_55031/g.159334  ORF Transcript_55031/g.159334 Transcript_55031/m.159334 type:complete len:658 (-) Transcript_55031:269-2242(-)
MPLLRGRADPIVVGLHLGHLFAIFRRTMGDLRPHRDILGRRRGVHRDRPQDGRQRIILRRRRLSDGKTCDNWPRLFRRRRHWRRRARPVTEACRNHTEPLQRPTELLKPRGELAPLRRREVVVDLATSPILDDLPEPFQLARGLQLRKHHLRFLDLRVVGAYADQGRDLQGRGERATLSPRRAGYVFDGRLQAGACVLPPGADLHLLLVRGGVSWAADVGLVGDLGDVSPPLAVRDRPVTVPVEGREGRSPLRARDRPIAVPVDDIEDTSLAVVLPPLLAGDRAAVIRVNRVERLLPFLPRDRATLVLVDKVKQVREIAVNEVVLGLCVMTETGLVQQRLQLLYDRTEDIEVCNRLPTRRQDLLAWNDPAQVEQPQRQDYVHDVRRDGIERCRVNLPRPYGRAQDHDDRPREDEEARAEELEAGQEDIEVYEQHDDRCQHHGSHNGRKHLIQVTDVPADFVVGQREGQPECAHGHGNPGICVVATPLPLQMLIQLQMARALRIHDDVISGMSGSLWRSSNACNSFRTAWLPLTRPTAAAQQPYALLAGDLVAPKLVPQAGQEGKAQDVCNVHAFELLRLRQGGVQLLVIRQWQADVLGLQTDVEGAGGHSGAGRQPHGGDQKHERRAQRHQLVPQDPFRYILGQSRRPQQRRRHAKL